MPLIYDVGLSNGDDSEYYLEKGFSVVGIDAHPDRCADCRRRFAAEMVEGRMTVLNVGVGATEALADFHIYDTEDAVSTFATPGFDTRNWRTIRMHVRPLSSIIRDHGTAHFIKIDVEHYDHLVLMDLARAGIHPPYISAECHSIDSYCALVCMGYEQFQLVDGESIPTRFSDYPIAALDGRSRARSFSKFSSGPFGDDLPGPWLDKHTVLAALMNHGLGWIDLHAKG